MSSPIKVAVIDGDVPMRRALVRLIKSARIEAAAFSSAREFLLYVEDADSMFNEAAAAGAKVKRPVADQFYGDRLGGIEDPFGHTWWISTQGRLIPTRDREARQICKSLAAAAAHL